MPGNPTTGPFGPNDLGPRTPAHPRGGLKRPPPFSGDSYRCWIGKFRGGQFGSVGRTRPRGSQPQSLPKVGSYSPSWWTTSVGAPQPMDKHQTEPLRCVLHLDSRYILAGRRRKRLRDHRHSILFHCADVRADQGYSRTTAQKQSNHSDVAPQHEPLFWGKPASANQCAAIDIAEPRIA